MKKLTVIVLAALLVTLGGSWTAQVSEGWAAGRGGHGGFGGHGGGHRGHGGGHFDIWFGPGWGWDPFFYPYYPPYPYSYPYPYYTEPPVVIQQQPQQYVVPEPQREEQSYWYYCRESKAYYPYVKRCPGGWLKVVPTPAPPGEEE